MPHFRQAGGGNAGAALALTKDLLCLAPIPCLSIATSSLCAIWAIYEEVTVQKEQVPFQVASRLCTISSFFFNA